MVAMTLVTIPLMDRAGRRTLHLVNTPKKKLLPDGIFSKPKIPL
jgi:hypothetical protein